MVQWNYQYILDDLQDMRDHLDSLFQRIHGTNPKELFLNSAEPGVNMQTTVQGNLRVDVIEHEDEVIVKADMIIGDQKKDIKLDLVEPQALRIFCERKGEKKDDSENYSMCERSFGSMTRIIPLPKPVTEDGSNAQFKDGVLEVRLKKLTPGPKRHITIE
jgi:HSP20 family protein